jgi:hypothetical protein
VAPLPVPGQVAPMTNAPMGMMPNGNMAMNAPPGGGWPMTPAPNPYANPYAAYPNPYPYGMPPPQAPAPTSSPYSWMSSTGTLFPTNLFQTRSAAAAPVPNAMSSNAPVYASNAPNFWGRSAPTTMPPTWGTYPPAVPAASAGVPPTVMR